MFRSEDGVFVLPIERAEKSRDFYIDTPKGRSERFLFSVMAVPSFEKAEIRFQFPKYTGWASTAQELDGREFARSKGRSCSFPRRQRCRCVRDVCRSSTPPKRSSRSNRRERPQHGGRAFHARRQRPVSDEPARHQRGRESRAARGDADFGSRSTAASGHSRSGADGRGGRGLESARHGAGGGRRGRCPHRAACRSQRLGARSAAALARNRAAERCRGGTTRSTSRSSGPRRATSSRITPRPTTTIPAAPISPTRRRR